MANRIDTLIGQILYTASTVDEVCQSLGFRENDMTAKEHDEFYEAVAQCKRCSTWFPAKNVTHYDFKYGFICDQCYEEK